MISNLCFDSVSVAEEGKPPATLTVDEYLNVSVHRRVQLMLSGAISFKLNGVEVPRNEALAELRSYEAAQAA